MSILTNDEKLNREKTLVGKLNVAREAYYNGEEVISNKEYDDYFDELTKLERETGIVLPDSPTISVGADVKVDALKKVKHEYPALSLDKTKDVDEMVEYFNTHKNDTCNDVVVTYKADGSTVQLTYDNGKLTSAVTRGNGEIGSDITHNAPYIKGIPQRVPVTGHLVVRGEALMTYKEFERLNELLPDEEKYKNPRNLANATISMLDSNEMKQREIIFKAFELVYADEMPDSRFETFVWLCDRGFAVIPNYRCKISEMKKVMQEVFTDGVADLPFPVDGLVVDYDDYKFAATLPGTSHNPNKLFGYAYKWWDISKKTVLRKIEWSPSRTGLLNPVAVFDPVELEGTTVTRCTLHNVSYVLDNNLQEGDEITIYKANMIIPALDKNLSYSKHPLIEKIETTCPCCGTKATYRQLPNQRAVAMECPNEYCPAKNIGKFVHFCERDCMNIVGLSEEKITFLLEKGYIDTLYSLISLTERGEDVTDLNGNKHLKCEEGWGVESVKNLYDAIKTARNVDFVSLIHSFGIPNVGKGQAKLLKKAVEKYHKENPDEHYADENYLDCLARMVWDGYDFTSVDGFGEVIATSVTNWVSNNLTEPYEMGDDYSNDETYVCKYINLTDKFPSNEPTTLPLAGLTFVITGDVHTFKNRSELQAKIEELGGKAAGSVSKNTSYLINNDVTSTSGKNQKAKELNVPIISEDDFLQMIQ